MGVGQIFRGETREGPMNKCVCQWGPSHLRMNSGGCLRNCECVAIRGTGWEIDADEFRGPAGWRMGGT